MTVLRLSDIHKAYGPRTVLDGFDLHVVEGERIGLIGANGTGKTTVLRLITGAEHCETGEVHVSPGLDVGHFSQMIDLDPSRSVIETVTEGVAFVHDLERQIHDVAHQLAEATDADEIDRLGRRHDRLVHEFEAHDGYNVDNRVETILSRFRIEKSDFDRPVGEFSGGWQKRIGLARVLVRNPELLLLDEPTNHLDADTVEWIEGLLAGYRGTLLIVTHDRYFLDNVVNRIVELENGRAQNYPGAYSDYLDEKTRRLEAARRAYDRQQEMLAHEREYIERTRAGQKHKQSTSRQKRLEKIDLLEAPTEARGFSATFREGRRLGDLVLELQDVTKAYDRELLGGLSLGIASNERLGIIGPNGCGKSTLLKMITGKLAPDGGQVRTGSNTEMAYHDQELAELDDESTLFDVVRAALPARVDKARQKVLSVLGQFMFPQERADDKVGVLSGGERARLLLARMTVTEPNLLIFDEPTNNLDIPSIRVLEESILGFPGAVIVVTHDRFFLDRVAGSIVAFDRDGLPRLYPGNYTMYRYIKQKEQLEAEAAEAERAAAAAASKARAKSTSQEKPAESSGKKKVNPREAKKEVERLERRIEACEAEMKDLTDRMNAGDSLSADELRELGFQYGELQQKADQLEARWTWLMEALGE